MSKPGWGIKPLTTTRIPGSAIVLAAQTVLDGDRRGYTESWRMATIRMTRPWGQPGEKTETYTAETAELLWDRVTRYCGAAGLTFLFVHDLQQVARVTSMLHSLPPRGWRLDALSLNVGAPWMVWRRRGATLKVFDLMSVWPTTLEQIGKYFNLGRKEHPGDDAPYLAWVAYGKADLNILATAVDSYVDWIRVNDLGSLSITGNGQAWSAFRRRFMPYGILVHHEEELLAMERRAMWTGRCEAYWHGSLLRQVVDEWDFSNAHNTIAQTHDVPTFPHGPIDPALPLEMYLADDRYHVLAEIEVETDVPVLPTLMDGHIVWPTGVFSTVVWGPELGLALDFCRAVRPVQGWLYRRAPALQGWANWVRSQLDADDTVVPACFKDLVKRWGNTLIGRFAMRYPNWVKMGEASTFDVYATPCVDVDNGEEYTVMQVGHAMWKQEGLTTPRNSAPMVTGFVMSVMRAKLYRLASALPDEALLYVDTDSLLVTDRWRKEMEALAATEVGRGLRLKRSWEGMNIYGPRQLVTGQSVRIAGLPKTASRIDRHEWAGETVESLQQAMAARSAEAVRITPRQWRIEGTDTRRNGGDVGWTTPFHVHKPRTATPAVTVGGDLPGSVPGVLPGPGADVHGPIALAS